MQDDGNNIHEIVVLINGIRERNIEHKNGGYRMICKCRNREHLWMVRADWSWRLESFKALVRSGENTFITKHEASVY